MKITMRLYRLHDLDLLYLYKMPNVSIQKIIKVVLKTYVQDRKNGRINKRIQLPRIEHEKKLPQSAQFHIYLNEGEDDEVIQWIDITPKGCRNSMIKNILRSYLDFPVTTPYEIEVEKTEKNSNDLINQLNSDLNGGVASKPQKTPKQPSTEIEKNTKTTKTEKPKIEEKQLNNDVIIEQKPSKQVFETQSPPVSTPATTTQAETDDTFDDDDLFDDFEQLMKNF